MVTVFRPRTYHLDDLAILYIERFITIEESRRSAFLASRTDDTYDGDSIRQFHILTELTLVVMRDLQVHLRFLYDNASYIRNRSILDMDVETTAIDRDGYNNLLGTYLKITGRHGQHVESFI